MCFNPIIHYEKFVIVRIFQFGSYSIKYQSHSYENVSVPFHMQGEVVAPGKGSGAEMTLKWLLSSVFTIMAGQLI